MDTLDRGRTAEGVARLGSLDPDKLWLLGLTIDIDGSVAGPGLRRLSFWAECECPDDCNRDHENE